MAELITSLTFLLVVIFYFLISKLREFYKVKSLRDLVAWSVNGGNGIPLWAEISNAQNRLKIQKEYCIYSDDEWDYVREIVDEYRKDLMFSYFKGDFIVIKSKYVISGECYFMASLYAFLSEHQCDYKFLGHDMHEKIVEQNGNWGEIHNVTYSLTEFAIVLHKMHYITYMYCKEDKRLSGFVPVWNEENLKEILDTKQIQIFWS